MAIPSVIYPISEREFLLLTDMLSDMRGDARVALATGRSIGPEGNQDVRATFIAQAEDLVARSNALHAALTLLGQHGLGPRLRFDAEALTITEAP